MSDKINSDYKFIKNNKFEFVARYYGVLYLQLSHVLLGMFPGDIPAFTPD